MEGTLDPDDDRKYWKGRWIRTLLLEGTSSIGRERTLLLEGTLDSDVVAGRDVVNWKGWEGTDVVEGRDVGFGRCCWKGRWIRTLLLEGTSSIGRVGREWTLLKEGTLDSDVVDGRERTLLMEMTLDSDVVDGRDVEFGRC